MFTLFKKLPFGLDISDYSIEALELKKRFGQVYLESYSRVKLDKGIVEDGKILNKEKLKEKFKELLTNALPRKLKSNQVIISLPESKTFVHIFNSPKDLKREELKGFIAEKAAKVIPISQEKLYWDFLALSDSSLLYVGVPKEIVDDYLGFLEDAGLEPLALDIESAGLSKTFQKERIKDGAILITDIGAKNTILTVVDQDSVRLSALVPIAGHHFSQAISEKLSISLEKADELKKRCGLDPEKEEGKIMLILQEVLQGILNEMKKIISFYREKEGRKVKKILLCGGSSFLPKLSLYFASNFDIEVKIPDPWQGIDVEELFKKKRFKKIVETRLHPVFFANVISLAKRGLEKNPEKAGINLIPEEKRVRSTFIGRELNRNKIFKILVVIFTVIAFIFLAWVFRNYILKIVPNEIPLTEMGFQATPEQLGEVVEEEKIEEETIKIVIQETETGWLRVRKGPGTVYPEIAKVYPGESYPLLEETEKWYKIELENDQEGWVFIKHTSQQ